MNNHIPFNAFIASLIVISMFYLAYADDDREDLAVYVVPALKAKQTAADIDAKEYMAPKDSPVTWLAPTNWQPTKRDRGFIVRMGSYNIAHADQIVDCSITQLHGSVASNINRWRGQAGLDSLSEEAVLKTVETRKCRFTEYSYVELLNPDNKGKSIAGAMYQLESSLLFVKFTGPHAAIKALKNDFTGFTDAMGLKQ